MAIFPTSMFWILRNRFVSLMNILLRSIVFAGIMVFKLSIHFEGILSEDREVLIVPAVFVFFWGVEGRVRELYGMDGLP